MIDGRFPIPPVWIFGYGYPIVLDPFHKGESARPNGGLIKPFWANFLGIPWGHHKEVGNLRKPDRVRAIGHRLDRELVDNVHRFQLVDHRGLAGALNGQCIFKSELDGISVEGLAVVEGYTLAQCEGPHQAIIRHFPLRRQPGLECAVRTQDNQRIHDLFQNYPVRR